MVITRWHSLGSRTAITLVLQFFSVAGSVESSALHELDSDMRSLAALGCKIQ
jgi:hypothetical protein